MRRVVGMFRRVVSACAGFVVLLGAGCVVGPDAPPRPGVDASEAFRNAMPVAAASGATNDIARWWTVFGDPQLDLMIRRAAVGGHDLRLAEARLREARALRGGVRAGLFPAVDASGSFSRSRISGNSVTGTGLGAFGVPLENDTQAAGFDLSWELDVFGGTRRRVEAASGDVAAAVEARNAARVSLLAEVGLNYAELRGLQGQVAVLRGMLRTHEDTASIARDRLRAGVGSELDVARATAQAERTRAGIPPLEEAVQRVIHRLSVLTGSEPGALAAELEPVRELAVVTAPGVPLGLPSELLRRRPDVRRAERELAAATARIGVATAELFPRFFLTGAAGLQSVEAGDLLDGGSRFWSLGPTLRWPVFAAGRIRQGIRVQEARQEQALIRYEQVVLTSLEETENALVGFGKEQERHRALRASAESSRRAWELAGVEHRAGLVDFLNVLEAERTLLAAREEVVLSERRLVQNLIRLYKAMGGGWELALSLDSVGLGATAVGVEGGRGGDAARQSTNGAEEAEGVREAGS